MADLTLRPDLVPTFYRQTSPLSAWTAAITLNANDTFFPYDCTGAGFTVTLPAAPLTNQVINFKNTTASTNNLTIGGNGKNIDGSATKVVAVANGNTRLQYDGSQWWVV